MEASCYRFVFVVYPGLSYHVQPTSQHCRMSFSSYCSQISSNFRNDRRKLTKSSSLLRDLQLHFYCSAKQKDKIQAAESIT